MEHSILFLGDIVARSGREALAADLFLLKTKSKATFTVVNGENASGGLGITGVQYDEIKKAGADCITLGDHAYHRKEGRSFLANLPSPVKMIRPANFPLENPGKGWTFLDTEQGKIVVVNLMGRTFMQPILNCPFRTFDELWPEISALSKVVLVDFHAEATSEKIAFGRHVSKRASLVVGTHTHVQTADDQIFENHTGYISDLGMCGSQEGVIGLQAPLAIQRFTNGMQEPYAADESKGSLHGVVARVDATTGQCTAIQRVRRSELA